jgi:2-dehydro-3-deoxygluconokinase
VRWFHSGGIFAALSATTGELIIEGMKAAKAAGAVTSLRSQLSREAVEHLRRPRKGAGSDRGASWRHVDVLVGNEEDLQKGLGIAGPEVAAKSKLDPSAFFSMIGKRRR